MKILYGVQGTGNGHITRARIMARALAKAGAEVDWVFSGRAPKDFFDMEPFGDYRLFKGLTFAIKNSRVRYGSTLLRSDLNALRRVVRSLDVDGYDLIINDFEPVSAWAARLAKKEVISLSHQNAFLYKVPKRDHNILSALFMRYFAPVTLPFVLHWHHFDEPLLSTPIEALTFPNQLQPNQYLVSLHFKDPNVIPATFSNLQRYQFF